jgi:hypothetical protein
MPGLLLAHVLAHLSLGGDCRRVAVRSAIAGGRCTRVTTPWALDTISGRDFTVGASIALAVSKRAGLREYWHLMLDSNRPSGHSFDSMGVPELVKERPDEIGSSDGHIRSRW